MSSNSVDIRDDKTRPDGQYYRDFASMARVPHGSIMDSPGMPAFDKPWLLANNARTARYFRFPWSPYTALLSDALCDAYFALAHLPVAFACQWRLDAANRPSRLRLWLITGGLQ